MNSFKSVLLDKRRVVKHKSSEQKKGRCMGGVRRALNNAEGAEEKKTSPNPDFQSCARPVRN